MSDEPTAPERCPKCQADMELDGEHIIQWACGSFIVKSRRAFNQDRYCTQRERDRLMADLERMRGVLQRVVPIANNYEDEYPDPDQRAAIADAENLLRAGEPKP